MVNLKFTEQDVCDLSEFLNQNNKIDFKSISLHSKCDVSKFNWKRFNKHKDVMLSTLKAYQRLIKIIPGNNKDIAVSLLKENIFSPVQIASMSKDNFVKECGKALDGENELASKIYLNAVKKKSMVLLNHLENTKTVY